MRYLCHDVCIKQIVIIMYVFTCFNDVGRYWEVTQRLKITQMFITPYVVKSLMKKQASENEGRKKEFDTSSLRVIATGGEPLQTFVMDWIRKRLGKGKCTFIDTWAQTGIIAHTQRILFCVCTCSYIKALKIIHVAFIYRNRQCCTCNMVPTKRQVMQTAKSLPYWLKIFCFFRSWASFAQAS